MQCVDGLSAGFPIRPLLSRDFSAHAGSLVHTPAFQTSQCTLHFLFLAAVCHVKTHEKISTGTRISSNVVAAVCARTPNTLACNQASMRHSGLSPTGLAGSTITRARSQRETSFTSRAPAFKTCTHAQMHPWVNARHTLRAFASCLYNVCVLGNSTLCVQQW